MDSLLGMLGLLFFMFLVLAAAVEVVLEIFRGALKRFGITWAKGKVSLDEALRLANEFTPNDTDLMGKLQAVKTVAEQFKDKASDRIRSLANIRKQLQATGANVNIMAAELNVVAAAVKADLEQTERQRICTMRLIAAVVGCALAYQADFYVFRMLAQAPGAKDFLASLPGLQATWINVLVGGFAAATGSSHWHDQLDRVRNLKSTLQDVKRLTA
jgi:hypothetical protein